MIEQNLNGTLLLTSSLLDQKISAKHPPPPSWASAKSRRSQSNDDVYNSESVSVYHVITYPASIITKHIITTLTSYLHHQFLGLAWYGQYIQWTPLFCIRNSLARSLQPFPSSFFPEKRWRSNFLVCLMNQKNVYCAAGSDQTVWNMNIHKNKISRKLLKHVSVLTPTTNYLYRQPCPRSSNIFKYIFRFTLAGRPMPMLWDKDVVNALPADNYIVV